MRDLYARLVLWMIRPALERHDAPTEERRLLIAQIDKSLEGIRQSQAATPETEGLRASGSGTQDLLVAIQALRGDVMAIRRSQGRSEVDPL